MPALVLLELLAGRARRAGARWLLVGSAIALAGLPLAVAPAVARTTEAAALRRAVTALPPGERSVIVAYSGLPDAAALARVDAAARGALAQLGGEPVRRQVLFNELADTAGRDFRLAVADDLATETRLVRGRLPGPCLPRRCEVVELTAGATAPDPRTPDPGLGLVVVGQVTRADPLLLSGTFDPGATVPVLVAAGVDRFVAPAPLASFGRSYGWVSGWDAQRVLRLGVDGWTAAAARAGDALAASADGAALVAPDQVLRDADARAQGSVQRLGLLAGGSCAVLLWAAVIGGMALRRDHEGFAGALRLRGAGGTAVGVLLVGEAVLAALLGAAGAVLGGGLLAALLAGRAGLPLGPTVLGATGSPALGLLVLLAAAAVALAIGLPGAGGRSGAWRALGPAAAGCLAAALLLAARGGVGVQGVGVQGVGAQGGDDVLLTALPVLALTGAGLLAARCWPPLVRRAQRLSPRRAVGARLGLAAAVGRPGRPAAVTGMLTAATAMAVFAGSYALTLDRGAADQAAHQVPLDARLLPGTSLVPPLQAVEPAALAAAVPGGDVYPVVRTAGSVLVGAQQAEVVALVGLDPAVLPRIARWPAESGSGTDPRALARGLGVRPVGRALPAGALLHVSTAARVDVAVDATVRAAGDRDGREIEVPLATQPGGGLTGQLPAWRDRAGARVALDLVALTVRQPADVADRQLHAVGEGSSGQAASVGTLDLGAVTVDGTPVPAPWTGWSGPTGVATVTPAPSGATLRVAYRLVAGEVVLVPGSLGVVPVLTDPATAATADPAAGGTVTLLIDGKPFAARPVAVLGAFPTVQGRFAVLDAGALAALIDRTAPGSASPAEVWLATGAAGRAALAGSPAALAGVDVQVRGVLEQALRSDPVAVAAVGLLAAGAGLVVAVAVAAVVLLMVAERADEAAVHAAWEADGVGPRTLRVALWWQAAVTVVPAAAAGTAAGIALAASAARLVAVTAAATTPVPPLRTVAWDPPVLAAAAAGTFALLALAAVVAGAGDRR